MADLQLTVYANPHYAPVSDYSEDVERLEACEEEARAMYEKSIAGALTIFHGKMADLQPYWQTPRYDREREAAKREFEKTSKPAHALRLRTITELFTTGVISEDLDHDWMALHIFALNAAIDNAERVGVKWAWQADELNLIDLHQSEAAE